MGLYRQSSDKKLDESEFILPQATPFLLKSKAIKGYPRRATGPGRAGGRSRRARNVPLPAGIGGQKIIADCGCYYGKTSQAQAVC